MPSTTSYPRLLGDIGGTNARFAWVSHEGAPLADMAVYAVAEHPGLEAVMARYLADHGKPSPAGCAIGIANPVLSDLVRMTNHHWSFSIAQVKRRFGMGRFLVINDFTALALSLPALSGDDLVQVGAGAPVAGAPLGLVGPGTGLGVSGLLPAAGRGCMPVNGEGGHATLAAMDEREAAVLAAMRARFGHVSAERAISGQGLVNLHRAVCEVDGAAWAELQPADITARALAGSDAQCVAVLDLFCSFLGNVAGNVALMLGARGGVYIGGGIVPRLGAAFARSRFRARFEDKGRFRGFLEAIPTYVVTARAPALIGVARALDDLPEPQP